MSRLKKWINKRLEKQKINPLWKLFLTGIKGRMQIKSMKPYNFYIKILSISATLGTALYFLDFKKHQIDRKGQNPWIPNYIYKVREQNYIYWQTVRIAKEMPTIFTYYKWDQNMIFQILRNGEQKPFLIHKGIQNTETFSSPLHEYNFPASPERHSKIIMYLKNIKNPYDLQNYLRWKPVNIGDWLRTLYYTVYRQLGLTNRWRYDQYVHKPDIYYRYEKLRLAFRLSRDRQSLYDTLDSLKADITWENIFQFFIWFM